MPSAGSAPTGRVEIYSQALLDIGQLHLPDYVSPIASTEQQTQWRARFPLWLTSAKWVQYCHRQFREIPSLRRSMPEPLIQLHPQTAYSRQIAELDWVIVRSPHGRIQARAVFNPSLATDIVCAQFGGFGGAAESEARRVFH